jgi:hypothetical protein
MLSRRLLQAAIALGGCVPVFAGLAGILQGAALTADHTSPALDSHLRYLSGLLLAIGLAFWSTIPRIETHRPRFLLLTLIVVTGGLARLYGLLTHPLPPAPMRAAAIMELLITPALCLWQRSLSARHD